MWTDQKQGEGAGSSPDQSAGSRPGAFNSTLHPNGPTARCLACLGATLEVKGEITSEEDLQIDGKVEGPISLRGQRLIVGRTGRLNSEVTAREVVVHGKVTGNLRARDRVDIKKDGSVIGDITTARISIEDMAHFKGRIEIGRSESERPADSESPAALYVNTEAS
jgi:cytoskeletal protein CcmA (bactofilin family)